MAYKAKVLNPAAGGTGIANSDSSTLAISGAFASTFTMTNTTSVTFPTSGTLATTAQLPSITATQYDVLVGGAANAVVSVGPGSAGQALLSGGNAANPAYSTPTYPSASGTSRKIIVSDGTNNVYSTETWAVPGTSGNVLTSNGTNWTSAAVTGPGGLTVVSPTLTNSQIKALHGTPVQAIAAPGAGKVIIVVSTTGKLIYGGTNVFTAGSAQNVNLYYGTTTAIIRLLANASIVSAASIYDIGQVFTNQLTVAIASLENTAVNIYVSSATEISGNAANNNTMSFSIMYYTISI